MKNYQQQLAILCHKLSFLNKICQLFHYYLPRYFFYPIQLVQSLAYANIANIYFRNQEEGILFDVGHGQGSFDWKVVEAAAHRGFWPNLISTDLHSGNVDGAAKDLCYVMTKLYSIGMPFPKVRTSKQEKKIILVLHYSWMKIGNKILQDIFICI